MKKRLPTKVRLSFRCSPDPGCYTAFSANFAQVRALVLQSPILPKTASPTRIAQAVLGLTSHQIGELFGRDALVLWNQGYTRKVTLDSYKTEIDNMGARLELLLRNAPSD